MSRMISPKRLDAIRARLARGDILHMQIGIDGGREWWFEAPYQAVPDAAIRFLAFSAAPAIELMELGDCLFPILNNSQSWQAIKGNA